MNAWKLILIDYLINPIGLDCVYNCADSETIDVNDIPTCADKWVTGGPSTGVYDMAQAGSTILTGQGTTVVTPSTFFSASNTFYYEDVIKMPDGTIWVANGPGMQNGTNMQGFSGNNTNPQTASGQKENIWIQCVDSMNQISFPDTTNYLDIFSSFVNKFCDNCGTESYCRVVKDPASPFIGTNPPTRPDPVIPTRYSNYLKD